MNVGASFFDTFNIKNKNKKHAVMGLLGHTFADSGILTATCFEFGFGPICPAYYSPKEHNQNSKRSGNLKTILTLYDYRKKR